MRSNTFIVLLFACLISCQKETITTEDRQERIMQSLAAHPWKASLVSRNGTDITMEYQGFTIAVASDGKYTTTNGGLAWPSLGQLRFQNESTTKLIRVEDDVEILIAETKGGGWVLKFTIHESVYNPGRVRSLEGGYVFELTAI